MNLPEGITQQMLEQPGTCDKCGAPLDDFAVIQDEDEDRVAGQFCHEDCAQDAFNDQAEQDARLNGVWKVA